MAGATVAKQTPLGLYDGISERLVKAQGICALASLLPAQSGNEIPDDALTNAMWAARDLLAEAGELASKLRNHANARRG